MPNTREKLIELLEGAKNSREIFCTASLYCSELIADHLIANGVTIQSEPLTNCQQWIPVSERLPSESEGTVLLLMPNKFLYNQKEPFPDAKHDSRVRVGKYSEHSMRWYIGDMGGVGGDDPIAWMPLPEPPKEDK